LIEDGRNQLLLRGPIALECPLRILQGQQDPDVPWRHALRIAEAVIFAADRPVSPQTLGTVLPFSVAFRPTADSLAVLVNCFAVRVGAGRWVLIGGVPHFIFWGQPLKQLRVGAALGMG
jgi:pimeloyl-ACP methyl ester carboxylesterase